MPQRSTLASPRRWSRLVARLLVLTALLAAGFAGPTFASNGNGNGNSKHINSKLQQDADANPTTQFRVIVTPVNNNPNALVKVNSKGGQKIKDVVGGAFVTQLKGQDLADVAADPSVQEITPDAPMVFTGIVDPSKLGTAYTLYPGAANATSLWGATPNATGAGIGVAVVDTGVNGGGRCDFNDAAYHNRVTANVLFNSGVKKTADGNGHGTHVAGIVAGNSWNCSDTTIKGKYVGVAPESNIINVRVADETGQSYISDVINAIDWVIQNRVIYNIRVMNLSLVSSAPESYLTSALDAEVEKAWFNGIFVAVAAGNAGPNTMGYPPANDPFVVTVGAADPMNTTTQTDDGMAPWSSYGTTQDGFSKPDLVAPGRYIASTLGGSWVTLATQLPTRIVDTNYIWLSGTSMASPVVAGVAALAFQAHPTWTNDQVKALLMSTTTPLGGATPLPGQGAGEVNAAAVVNFAGTPAAANQNQPISAQLTGPNGATVYTTGALANSTSSWSTSSWSTSSWSTSSWSTSTWSTSTWSTTAQFASFDTP